MTRRMIDSGMWSNENFAALPAMARLLQIGIINHADDQGRIKAHPLYLAKEIFPYDRVTPTNIAKWLDLIAGNGTILLYNVEGKQYAQLTKWWDYQSLQYASPSDHPAPPNWLDRIRRTATKGTIVTYNWTLTNGVVVEDTCDQYGKPLPPKASRAKPPVPPPANSNGHSPDYSPVPPPEPPPEHTNKLNLIEDQLNLNEREIAREPEPAAPLPTNPPPSYRLQPEPGEYIPGVRRPQYNQAKRNADQFAIQAQKHNIGPEPFRMMVDLVLDATGKTTLANTSGERGTRVLNAAKQTIVDLLELKRTCVEDIQDILTSWRQNDYRGTSPPTFDQIVEHASAMDAGMHLTARRPDSNKKDFASMTDYNEWAARYDPEYKRIREGILVKGTFIKRADYHPELRH